MKKRVVLGLSGGVDSAVAAYLLKQQGYEVIGVFMRNWDSQLNNDILGNPTNDNDICPQEQDYNDAKAVAKHLGIEIRRVDFIKEYWDKVFTYFIDEYAKGRTPNPDILCNKHIKFKAFLEYAEELNADFIATGHYARVEHHEGKDSVMLKGIDQNKDQTYFLCQLNQKQLQASLFPLGNITKQEVRKIAEELDLPVAHKKDSTGICFIGERKFKDFLERYLPAQPGDIRTVDGEIIGRHEGLMYHTLGQRKGLGIGGLKNAGDEAWYVVDKDVENNELIVAQGHDHPRLFSKGLIAKQLHWVSRESVREAFRCTVKTRYRQTDIACLVEPIDDDCIRVIFDEPQAAVTPGQSAVFYLDEVCLGGGIIEERI